MKKLKSEVYVSFLIRLYVVKRAARLIETLGTIQLLRKQKGGWVGYAKCLHLLTWWVGGSSKMLT